MSIRLGIVSDIHTEHWRQEDLDRLTPRLHETTKDADIILLAGDIGSGVEAVYAARYLFPDKPVCMVAGNHEFYRQDIDTVYYQMAEAAGSNIHFLNCDCYVSHEFTTPLRVLGCTLWTDFDLFGTQALSMGQVALRNYKINGAFFSTPYPDFQSIRHNDLYVSADDLLQRHYQDWRWLRHQLDVPFAGLTVLLTHHAPASFAIPPHLETDVLAPCFASRLEAALVRPDLPLVVSGHTHYSLDRQIDRTRFVSNQMGYLGSTLRRPFDTETGQFGTTVVLDDLALPANVGHHTMEHSP